jgi:hypothetical protein
MGWELPLPDRQNVAPRDAPSAWCHCNCIPFGLRTSRDLANVMKTGNFNPFELRTYQIVTRNSRGIRTYENLGGGGYPQGRASPSWIPGNIPVSLALGEVPLCARLRFPAAFPPLAGVSPEMEMRPCAA